MIGIAHDTSGMFGTCSRQVAPPSQSLWLGGVNRRSLGLFPLSVDPPSQSLWLGGSTGGPSSPLTRPLPRLWLGVQLIVLCVLRIGYIFHFVLCIFSVFSLCSAAMFGHHVRETCSGLSGGMFDWTLCSAGCSNVRNCLSFEFLCFEPNVRMFVEHVFGSYFGSECSKSN